MSRIRKALIACVPLMTVQGFLAAINIVDAGRVTWSIYPILAMMIPESIILGTTLLSGPGGDKDKNRARELARNASDRVATANTLLDTSQRTDAPIDGALQSHVTRVRDYQRELARLAKSAPTPVRAERLTDLSKQFDKWVKDVEGMAQRVHGLRGNPLVRQDMKTVPESIRKLAGQLSQEKDPRVRQSLEQTLIARQSQLQALEKLQSTARYAEVQLENTVASLGAIYSQALANQSTSQVADHRHLASDVDDRVKSLQDELASIEEVRMSGNLR
jgi:hypothetical protein